MNVQGRLVSHRVRETTLATEIIKLSLRGREKLEKSKIRNGGVGLKC
jgi:hypothetical protein